jgi:hypothetical protein
VSHVPFARFVACAAVIGATPRASAQTAPAPEQPADVTQTPESEAKAPSRPLYSIGMLLQLREQQTKVSIAPGLRSLVMQSYPSASIAADTLRIIEDTARERDGLLLRRAFLRFEVNPTETLRGEVLLDFARLLYPDDPYALGPTQMVRVASAEYSPVEAFAVEAGITELPFSVLEQFHDTGLEVAEEGPTHELLHRLRYVGSDIGVVVRASPLPEKRWLELRGGVFDSGSTGAQGSRAPGLLALRASSEPVGPLRLGAGIVWRPHSIDAWWEELRFRYEDFESGAAFGADATLSFERLVVRAEWLTGKRTDVDVVVPLKQRRGDARTFMSTWGMAALRWPVGGIVVIPALRAEYLDTDREHSNVGGILHFSGAVNVDLSERVRVLADISRHYVQFGTRNWNFDLVRYDTDYTSGTVQVQWKL